MSRPVTATIHIDALRHNLAVLRAAAPGRRLMAMVKADGYGHGLEAVARALGDADAFGVASIRDVERIRAIGLVQPVLVLSGFDSADDIVRLRRLDADAMVHRMGQLELLEQNPGVPLRCWLKIDTGMHRLGFAPDDVREAHARLSAAAAVADEIVLMTHFASSDAVADASCGCEQTRAQIRVFDEATAGLPGPRSLANSAAVLGWPASHGDWLRPGGALYGMSLVKNTTGADFGLRPAMTLSTRLLAVNRIDRGERIGYGGTWTCPERMPLGVAAIGYGDGYPRAAPSGTPVLVNGTRASIVGRISMDLVTIDLRARPDAKAGDAVVLWGDGLPVETVAASAGSIGYELTCSVTRRVRFVEG